MEDTNYTMELAENFEDENFETKRFKSTKETRYVSDKWKNHDPLIHDII